jgi:multidrug efflux pump subunit AcrA (membrane-fusion protein)
MGSQHGKAVDTSALDRRSGRVGDRRAVGGTIATRVLKKFGDTPGKGAEAVVLEFSPADLAKVDAQPLSRWLPVSGTVRPLRQATGQGEGLGRRPPGHVREGESVKGGQLLARIDTADLEAKLIERSGASNRRRRKPRWPPRRRR